MLNQTAMSSTSRAKHLVGLCCHEIWGGIITCRCPTLFCSPFLVSSWFQSPMVGGEPVCCIHLILHDVKNISWHHRMLSIFCHFQTAWWLATFCASTMLFRRRDNCYHSLMTCIFSAERNNVVLNMYFLIHGMQVSYCCWSLFNLSNYNLPHLLSICNSVAMIGWWLWTWSVKMTRVSRAFMLC